MKSIILLVTKVVFFGRRVFKNATCRINRMFGKQKETKVSSDEKYVSHSINYNIRINIKNPRKLSSFVFSPGTTEFINSYFDNIYVINLKNRTDRLMDVLQKLKRLNIQAEIVEAVNGYESPHKEEYEKYLQIPIGLENAHHYELEQKRKMIISPGAWGCLKSVRMAVSDAQKKGYKRILLLDDDIIFIKNFHVEFKRLTENIGNNEWKILALGATQHVWKIPECLFYPDKSIKEYSPNKHFYHPLRTDGSFALGVDHSVFSEIVDEIDKMNCSVDSGAFRSIYKKHLGKSFVAQPNIIIANVSDSNIGKNRSQEDLAKKLKWDMSKYDYPFKKDLVSIIMPTYNAEETIEMAIQSLLRQSYKEIEIIIADDGSTDSTPEIVNKMQKKDSRVIYKRFEINRGCYFVRNDAIRLSNGKYIAINDADDFSLSNRIETQVLRFILKKLRFTIGRIIRSRCSVSEIVMNDEHKMLKLVHERREKNKYGNYDYYDREIIGLNTSMFSRDLFEEHGLFWEERFSSDMEIIERVLFHEAGITFPNNGQNVHTYLDKTKSIHGIFELIDETLLISPIQNKKNLTHAFPIHGEERKKFEKKWRRKLRGAENYQYPSL